MCLTSLTSMGMGWTHPYLHTGPPTWVPALETGPSLYCQPRRPQPQSEAKLTDEFRERTIGAGTPIWNYVDPKKCQTSQPTGLLSNWARGDEDKARVIQKHPYRLGTPWGWDIPTLLCPLRPCGMKRVWAGGSKANLSVGLTGGKDGSKEVCKHYQEENMWVRHLVHTLGIPLRSVGCVGGLPQLLIILGKMMR